jgi:ElaB/YqjD/DUF883 family membrane-anchored ribosome-binding protein
MVTREELRGQWDSVKDQLMSHWRELSEKDLAQSGGTPSQLIGTIQKKTGATWNEIESFIANLVKESRSKAQQAGGLADRYGDEAGQLVKVGYDQLANVAQEYSKKVTRTVQRRPVESLALAFGVGLLAGAAVLLSSRRR